MGLTLTVPRYMLSRYQYVWKKLAIMVPGTSQVICHRADELTEVFGKLTESVCKRSEECTNKILSAKEKKTDLCRKMIRRSYDEKHPFPLDYERWIGSTARRYASKRKQKLARLQRVISRMLE